MTWILILEIPKLGRVILTNHFPPPLFCFLFPFIVYVLMCFLLLLLKHKDSFGKSENLSKIFFAEILVFDHDYEGKSSSSNGLLWISSFFFLFCIWIIFRIVRRASEQIYTRYQLYFARCNYYQIVNLTSVQSVKVV